MKPAADLEVLRRTDAAPPARPARAWLPRLTVGALVLGALGAAYALAKPLLFPPRPVRLGTVRVETGAAAAARGGTVDAAGWLEADPYAVTVRPLVKGVVETLDVLEGQTVERGKTRIALLRNPDLENALRVAEATLAAKEADVVVEEAHLAQKRALLEQRLLPRTEVRRLEGEAAAARAAVEAATAAEAQADAARKTAVLEREALEDLRSQGGAAPIRLRVAEQKEREADAALAARAAETRHARAEAARVEGLLELAREGERDPRELSTEVPAHEAHVAKAKSERDLAKVEVEIARANVALLTVVAPTDGVVMQLLAAPGAVAGPMEQMRTVSAEAEGTTSSGVLDVAMGGLVRVYDPKRLAARIDVPLQQVGAIGVGTEAEVTVQERRYRGTVARVAHEANILKVTLQVKVRLLEPDASLRPEMFAKARFTTTSAAPSAGGAPTAQRVWVPTASVRDGAVYVLDPRGGGRARRVPVTALGTQGEWTEVEGALGLSSRPILDPVEEGERIRASE